MKERTLSILKPDTIEKKITGLIIAEIENAGFDIIAQKRIRLTKEQAENFYAEHKGKAFFDGLVEFIVSRSVVVQVLEKENAIQDYRNLMGATQPEKQLEGTIRKKFATDIQRNCVHGSDSPESASREISFFFSQLEIL